MAEDTPSTFETFGLSRPARDPCADLIGQTIDGRYMLEGKLGEGGFGCVFLARQKSPNRQVAVKVQKYAGRESHRMAKEADLLARLDDRGIARVFEAGDWASPTGTRIFVAMELVAGGIPLHTFCIERKLSVSERLTLFREVCRAVSVAHREGIIHRDLKPGNILVDKHGQPRVIDFGISKLIASEASEWVGELPVSAGEDTTETRSGAFLGTPTYAAPEQRLGEATSRSDVHALGMILKNDLFTDLQERVPRWLAAIVARSTARDPSGRPADAAHLMADVDRILQSRARRRRRYGQLAAVAAVVLVVAVAAPPFVDIADTPHHDVGSRAFEVTLLDGVRIATGDPAGRRLATAIGPEVVVSVSGSKQIAQQRLTVAGAEAMAIAFGGAGAIVAASDAGGWQAWDLPGRAVDSRPLMNVRADAPMPTHAGLIAVSPDGGTLFAQTGPRSLVAYAIRSGARQGATDVAGTDARASITSVAPAARADAAFVGLSDGSVRRWSLASGSLGPIGIEHGPGAVLLAASPDGTSVASYGSDGRVAILDGQTSAVLHTAKLAPSTPTGICFGEGDDIMVSTRSSRGDREAVLRLSRGAHGEFVISGSASVMQPLTGITCIGGEVLAIVLENARERTDVNAMLPKSADARSLTVAAHDPSPH